MKKSKKTLRRRTKSGEIPQMLLHRGKNLAYMLIEGKPVYLGKFGSKEAEEKRIRVWEEYQASKGTNLNGSKEPVLVYTLVARFYEYAKQVYIKNGRSTWSAERIGIAARPLAKLYGDIPVDNFGPIALKVVRKHFENDGLSRKTINMKIGFIRQIFKWGVENEMVRPETLAALKAVSGLKAGRTKAPERPPVRPVKKDALEEAIPFMSRIIADMVQVQRLTGMRPGEVVSLRPADIFREGDEFPEGYEFMELDGCWVFIPEEHKTEHHKKQRWLVLGPRCQKILEPYLNGIGREEYVFSPEREHRRRMEELREKRKTPVQPSQVDRTKPEAKRKPGKKYLVNSYRHAVQRAIDQYNETEKKNACRENREAVLLPKWFPNQLRHLKGTEVRATEGIETARAVLGHSNIKTTEIYAEVDRAATVKYGKENS